MAASDYYIYKEEELHENATTELFSVVQQEGKRKVKRDLKFYNLNPTASSCTLPITQ